LSEHWPANSQPDFYGFTFFETPPRIRLGGVFRFAPRMARGGVKVSLGFVDTPFGDGGMSARKFQHEKPV
jgi:hypothetical protein